MNEEKDKPIRGLLRDISLQTDTRRAVPRGIVSPQIVDRLTIVASLVSLILTTSLLLGMIWQSVDLYVGLRCIGSTMVVMLSLLAFRMINALFD